MEARIKTVRCIENGHVLKIVCHSVTESEYTAILAPVFKSHGDAVRLSEDEVTIQNAVDVQYARRQESRSQAVGDLGSTQAFLADVARMRGDGGRPSKKRRAADRLLEAFAVSQRVAASNLR